MSASEDMETQRLSLEKFKLELDRYKADLDAHQIRVDKWSTGFNGIMALGTLGIKSLILVNGAAVISLLTFIGNRAKIQTPECFTWAFGAYLVGIALALVCVLMAYIFQVIEIEFDKKRLSHWLRIAAVIFAVLSLLAFVSGSVFSIYGFAGLEPITETSGVQSPGPAASDKAASTSTP